MTVPQQGPILVPTDFSPFSSAALALALEMGPAMKRDVICLHVVHDPAHAPGYYQEKNPQGVKTMDEVAGEMMHEFLNSLKQARPDLPVEVVKTELIEGIPSRRVPEYAVKINASMIVMGSHGRGTLHNMLIGSKSMKVLQRAQIPVMIVKMPRQVTEVENTPHA